MMCENSNETAAGKRLREQTDFDLVSALTPLARVHVNVRKLRQECAKSCLAFSVCNTVGKWRRDPARLLLGRFLTMLPAMWP